MKTHFSFSGVVSVALLMILSGCGAYNNGSGSYNVKVAKPTSVTADSTGAASATGYACQATAVVLPPSGPSDGSGKYKVCTSNASLTEIQLQGRPMYSNQICAYPVRVVGADPAVPAFDAYGNPVVSCVALSKTAVTPLATLSFPGVTYNALAVIDMTDEFGRQQKDQMDQCLRTRIYSNCPVYSYGVFR